MYYRRWEVWPPSFVSVIGYITTEKENKARLKIPQLLRKHRSSYLLTFYFAFLFDKKKKQNKTKLFIAWYTDIYLIFGQQNSTTLVSQLRPPWEDLMSHLALSLDIIIVVENAGEKMLFATCWLPCHKQTVKIVCLAQRGLGGPTLLATSQYKSGDYLDFRLC